MLMNSKTRRANRPLFLTVLMLVSALVLTAAYTREPATVTGEAAAPMQDTIRIESRLSQLEQRFYSIEVSIRSLEQQVRQSSINTGRTERDTEVSLLRAEVEALRRQLAEVECGLARLDERTLTAAAREARRRAGASANDPCRLNTSTPLRLPTRQ
jgi:hypothetical protein